MNKITIRDLHKVLYKVALVAFLCGLSLALIAVEIVDAAREHAPQPEPTQISRPQFGTLPPDCGYLYNVGMTNEWRACMLIPRRPQRRNDI